MRNKPWIVTLGNTGMLGSMVAKVLDAHSTSRQDFDAEDPDLRVLGGYEWIINCIGLIKPYCADVEKAIRINALFPHQLPENTIQIATDCVYSGKKGDYIETDPHDATDVYGKTKSLGEAPYIKNLRCSIIGPELNNHLSLLEWALSKGEVLGFTNHRWNGITTYHFAKICQGVIRENIPLPPLQHIVPANSVTKAELLRVIAKEYGHTLNVIDTETVEAVDRTLSTENPQLNETIWRSAGYEKPPTIQQMIKELVRESYDYPRYQA